MTRTEKIERIKEDIAMYFECFVEDLKGKSVIGCIEQIEEEAPHVAIYWGGLENIKGIEEETF